MPSPQLVRGIADKHERVIADQARCQDKSHGKTARLGMSV